MVEIGVVPEIDDEGGLLKPAAEGTPFGEVPSVRPVSISSTFLGEAWGVFGRVTNTFEGFDPGSE